MADSAPTQPPSTTGSAAAETAPERSGAVRPLPLSRFVGAVPSFDLASPGVAAWHDNRDRLVARSTTEGAYHWMWIDGVGTYRFPVRPLDPFSVPVEVSPDPRADPATVEDFYLRSVLPVALQANGCEALHGSAVEVAGAGVVALCGKAESGKSTLAYALTQRGHRHVADDAVVIEPRTRRVLPLPTAARLRRQSATHFGARSKDRVRVSLAGWDESAARPLPLAAAVFLRRGAPRLTLRRLASGTAFNALLTEAYAFTLTDASRKRALVKAYLDLAGELPLFELSYPDGLEHVSRVCDSIESLAAEAR